MFWARCFHFGSGIPMQRTCWCGKGCQALLSSLLKDSWPNGHDSRWPNPDILDKPELLKDLTRQFRTFVSRSRQGNIQLPGIFVEILLNAECVYRDKNLTWCLVFFMHKKRHLTKFVWLQEFDKILAYFVWQLKPNNVEGIWRPSASILEGSLTLSGLL